MTKEIKTLLAKEGLTGEEAGRLMILDLLAAYKNLMKGGEGSGVLSDAQKIEIVESLTMPEDIQRFNDYRGVHDFLTTVSAIYESYAKTYEVYYWKLLNVLMNMKYAEDENNLSAKRPVIMTKEQYSHFIETGETAPKCGIAVINVNPSEPFSDENGRYNEAQSKLRCDYMAETVLSRHSGLITECIDGMKDMLAECIARRRALELFARFIKIPYIKKIISPVNEQNITAFNIYISDIVNSVNRSESHGAAYEKELREKLSSILTPIDLSKLEPLPQSVANARRFISFSVIKNGSEVFVAMLKRRWRDE